MVTPSEKKRKKIYKLLGKHGILDVALKFNVKEDYVRKVIRGERKNLSILKYVIDLASEKSHKLDETLDIIKSSLKNI